MGARQTAVQRQARRRWITVLTSVAVLCALPVAVRAGPARAAAVDIEGLRARIGASATQPFHGYAQSNGLLGLPALPRLAQVTALFSGTTQLRAWYADPDRWRVDVIGPGTERGLYRTPAAEWGWDYGDNQLTRVEGVPPARLPRAADLLPPDLARRLVAASAGEPAVPLPARRVAGIAAAGLRIVPADPRTTVGQIDIWAVPDTGLPVQVQVTGRGGARPVLTTRFLELDQGAPAGETLTPPQARPGMGYTTTAAPDLISAADRLAQGPLPDRLAGQPRRVAVAGVSAVGLYGVGLAQFVVAPLPGRLGRGAYQAAVRWGRQLTYPTGRAALLSTPLLSMVVVQAGDTGQTYVIVGMVQADVLQSAGSELAGQRR
jgi:hypothetical protein